MSRTEQWTTVKRKGNSSRASAPAGQHGVRTKLSEVRQESLRFASVSMPEQRAIVAAVISRVKAHFGEVRRSTLLKQVTDLLRPLHEGKITVPTPSTSTRSASETESLVTLTATCTLNETKTSSTQQPATVPLLTTTGQLDVVCLGIGPFGSSRQAQMQLALVLLLAENLKTQGVFGEVSVYDPILTRAEEVAATELGLVVHTENTEGKHTVTRPTLFYLPHCGRTLYEHVLWANWGPLVNQVYVLGNSFAQLSQPSLRSPAHARSSTTQDASCIRRLSAYTTEIPLSDEGQTAFSDHTLHSFQVPAVYFMQEGKERPPLYLEAIQASLSLSTSAAASASSLSAATGTRSGGGNAALLADPEIIPSALTAPIGLLNLS